MTETLPVEEQVAPVMPPLPLDELLELELLDEDEQVAPVMPPPPLLLLELLLELELELELDEELELLLELDEPVPPYEQ